MIWSIYTQTHLLIGVRIHSKQKPVTWLLGLRKVMNCSDYRLGGEAICVSMEACEEVFIAILFINSGKYEEVSSHYRRLNTSTLEVFQYFSGFVDTVDESPLSQQNKGVLITISVHVLRDKNFVVLRKSAILRLLCE